MEKEGVIELDYKGKPKRIEFSLNISGYGGLPMLTLRDKNNHHYPFTRGHKGEWRSLINNLKWPDDFLEVLREKLEEKYQKAI